jgi:HK97 family phage major capsid protein
MWRPASQADFNSTDPADDIVDLVYSVDARYRANGAFVMNSTTAGAIRKMKDVDGRFLWADQMCEGQPARLFGYPVVICENMPSISADAFAIAFGDFQAGYTIAERPDLRILRDPYSAKPHVQFFVSSRVGGAVVDFDAIRLLKFGVS